MRHHRKNTPATGNYAPTRENTAYPEQASGAQRRHLARAGCTTVPTEAVGGYVRKITDAQGASPAVKQWTIC